MLAVTFQEPGRVAVEKRPEPELIAADDAVVRVDASGICGSDLHIFHGRVQIEPGFTIGHEYVGEVVAAGDGVTLATGGGRRPWARHLSQRLRPLLLLPQGRVPEVRRVACVRARQDARVAAGNAG